MRFGPKFDGSGFEVRGKWTSNTRKSSYSNRNFTGWVSLKFKSIMKKVALRGFGWGFSVFLFLHG